MSPTAVQLVGPLSAPPEDVACRFGPPPPPIKKPKALKELVLSGAKALDAWLDGLAEAEAGVLVVAGLPSLQSSEVTRSSYLNTSPSVGMAVFQTYCLRQVAELAALLAAQQQPVLWVDSGGGGGSSS